MKEFNLFSLKGKVIVVTGSTGGLGTHFVKNLAWAGADLAILDMPATSEKLEALSKEVAEEYGCTIRSYTIDLASEADIEAKRDAVLADFGHIDGLLNIAGVNQHGTIDEYSKEDVERVLNINIAGTFTFCKYFAKPLCEQGHGSVVNIASVSGSAINRAPRPMSVYCASKAGLIHATKGMAAEFGQHNVRANTVSPGFMETRMNNVKGFIQVDPAINQQYLVGGTPMNRFCKADELTGAAIYLLSDASTFTNGIDIVVDGGFLVW